MRNLFIVFILTCIVTLPISCQKAEKSEDIRPGAGLSECVESFKLKDGDIIFQSSVSSQSRAV